MIYFVTVGDLICVMRTMYNVCTRQLCEHLWTKIHIEKSVSPCHCHMRKQTYTSCFKSSFKAEIGYILVSKSPQNEV
jgi:hypothetical protein